MKNTATIEELSVGAQFTDDHLVTDIHATIRIRNKIVASEGNFICISGLPKARKTAFSWAFISSYFLLHPVHEISCHRKDERPFLLIDTESTAYSFSKHASNFKRRINKDKIPADLLCYLVREHDQVTIIDLLKYLIQKHNPAFILIDNLTDLVGNVNDPEEAKNLISLLKKITKESNCTLIGLIHLSKSNNYTIGWLGSYTDRASQSTLKVTKDPDTDTSTLEATLMRDDAEFKPVTIYFDDAIKDYKITEMEEKPKDEKFNITKKDHQYLVNLCDIVFTHADLYVYDDLIRIIKEITGTAENYTKRKILPYLLEKSYLIKTDQGYKNNPNNKK